MRQAQINHSAESVGTKEFYVTLDAAVTPNLAIYITQEPAEYNTNAGKGGINQNIFPTKRLIRSVHNDKHKSGKNIKQNVIYNKFPPNGKKTLNFQFLIGHGILPSHTILK